MNMTLSLTPLISLIAGILILVVPRLLNYIVAIYLIVIGLFGLQLRNKKTLTIEPSGPGVKATVDCGSGA